MSRRSERPKAAPIPSPPAPAPSWTRPVVLALAALLLFGWFAIPSTDSDAWWHLKTGQYLLQTHKLPIPDPFAYTTYLKPPLSHGEALARDFNLTHSWLGQIIFYLAYAAAGYGGVIALRALLLTAFSGVVGWIVWQRTGGLYRAVGAAIAAAGVAMFSTSDRPFLFTYLLLAATIAILEARRPLWLLPPLFVLWANLHPGFFLGWVAVACYCIQSLFESKRSRTLYLASAAAILASGLNPNGFKWLEVLVQYRNSPMQSQLYEWQHPRFWESSWYSVVLWVGLITLIVARRKVRVSDWLLFALFAAASLQAVRNVTLMALIGPVVIFTYAGWNWAQHRAAAFIAVALLAAGLTAEIGWRQAFQFHAEMWQYPQGAADFLLQHHIAGRMFNTYEQGGYWLWRLWPENQVFIDGRALNETVYADSQRIEYTADAGLLRQYGVDLIAMNCFQVNTGGIYLLPASLADPSQKEWKLVYRDAQAVVFMRNPPAGVPVLNSREVLTSMDDQCNTILEHTPWKPGCAQSLGGMYNAIGDQANAARWMATFRTYAGQ